jgi:hypothetical protein
MSSQAEHSKNLPLAKGREQLLITSPAIQIRLGRKYCDKAELLPLLLAHGVVQEAREVRDSTDQDTKRARTTEHTELILVSPELQTLLGKKECTETELLPLLLSHGYIRSVRTVQVQVHPLSGEDFHVTLEATKPSVGETKLEISRTHGTRVELQELYRYVIRADGGAVREDDAEPELLDDATVLEEGSVLAMVTKEMPIKRLTLSENDDVDVNPPPRMRVHLLRAYYGNPQHLRWDNGENDENNGREEQQQGTDCTMELREKFKAVDGPSRDGTAPGQGLHLKNRPFLLNRLVTGGDPMPGYIKDLVLEYQFG